MTVTQLIDQVRRQVPDGAALGTRFKASAIVRWSGRAHEVAVAARMDAHGLRREQFWCDGVRVEHAVLLRLTCPEGECPHVLQVRAQWEAFRRKGKATAARTPPTPRPLISEATICVGGQHFVVRPARFPCFTPCPNGAHPAMTLEKAGFDLFDADGCVGGGIAESSGYRRPRLPDTGAVEAYVLGRHLEALAVVNQARDSSRARPGPTPGQA
ncbi:hypothetical protein [Rubrivivax albus]|uniref:Uncharacterized protein n=1 Tax=Rubrivivax albus TaxID=2499835 RepID=A0A3S3SB01_9BURK|nr:hypothetical protein [Rubrivivax albus]MCB1997800.1 hypothetical protein [Rhodoferax sp.]RVT50117.1 hypothetical protein ENE75_17570 [Rubrivivax albus]